MIVEELGATAPSLRRPVLVSAICTLLVALATLYLLGVSPIDAAVVACGLLGLILLFRYPVTLCGLLLLSIPLNFLVVMCLKFIHSPLAVPVAGTKELGAIALILVLLVKRRGPLRLLLPDYFLLAFILLAGLRQLLGGTVGPVREDMGGTVFNALRSDFDWVLTYVLGRLLLLDERRMDRWSRAALWLVSLLAIGSAYETFILGPLPRQLLYIAVVDSYLSTSFTATGYGLVRASATMVGPLEFGALCMVALIIVFTYRKPIAVALLPLLGLLLSVSRSAIIGSVIALFVLAIRRKYIVKFVAGFIATALLLAVLIPVLGLSDLVAASSNGTDPSLNGHQNEIRDGFQVIADHPLGLGAGSFGPSGRAIESSFVTIPAEYGVPAGIMFASFVVACFLRVYSMKTNLGDAVSAIIAGFVFIMLGQDIHQSPYISFWIWLPVGMAVARSGVSVPGRSDDTVAAFNPALPVTNE
jgi:hypothetical protein